MKQLLILSGKGGTGKTTICSSFIKLLDLKIYADCDVDAPNLHLVVNQKNQPKHTDYYGLPKALIDQEQCIQCDLCRQNCRFDAIYFDGKYIVDNYACEGCGVCEYICSVNAITLKPAIAGELLLYLSDTVFSTATLKMGSGTSGKLVTEVKKQMIKHSKEFDLSIIDGSPGIGCPVIASLSGVDMVLIVAEPSVSGISDMKRIIQTSERFVNKIAILINKYDSNIENTKIIGQYCLDNHLSLVGKIPYDANVIKIVNKGQSIVDFDCEASRQIALALNETLKILEYNNYYII